MLQAELDEATARADRLEELQSLTHRVLGNGCMTATDCIIAVKLVAEIAYQQQRGTTEVPIYLTEIAERAGVGRAAVTRFLKKVEGSGLLTKRSETVHVAASTGGKKGRVRTTVYIDQQATLFEALTFLAAFDPHRRRPGGNQRGKKPGPDRYRCPDCGSDHTSLDCRSCGVRHDSKEVMQTANA
jgi:hypothetical protein